MAIPEYDNAVKWVTFFRGLPRGLKVILSIVVILIIVSFVYIWFGPIRDLQYENSQLSTDLAEAQREIASLRDKKNELHRENLNFKDLMDPIQRKAKFIYPEMETAAAIAKLSDDLQNVRSLATRDVYKPLVKQQREKLVIALKELLSSYSALPVKVSIVAQQGNHIRIKVANDLKEYLQEAGWNVKVNVSLSIFGGIPPDITIGTNTIDLSLTKDFKQIVGTLFINKQFEWIKRDELERGQIVININGDPLFFESGIVTFR